MSPAWSRSLALVVVAASLNLVSVMTGSPVAAQTACTDPFSPDLHAAIAEQHPDQRVTAAVFDTRTGCWYHLAPGTQIQTASVSKAQFLAGVLLRAQDEGRPTTAWERERITPMISLSHNPPATDLFLSLGGISGQEALDERFGLTATTSTNKWGATVSTAEDRTRLALALLHGGGPLTADRRAEAWAAMTAVHPTQQWGITAGVAEGWTVALKNGFHPTSGAPAWRIGSTGFVRHDATREGYAITVMTDQNPDHLTGQRLVELVAAEVARTLTGGEPAPRDVDRSICVAARDGERWDEVADRLRSSDPAAVRSVSGGPASPLAGMRACRPDLAADFDPDGPIARFVTAASRTFLGRDPSSTELTQHAVAIEAGAISGTEHTRSLSQSLEWISITIDDLYERALGRTADDAGRRYWREQVLGGLRITDVGALFYGSDEFHARNGGTDGFVEGLYRELLHRAPDPAGAAHWQDQLRSGTSRVTVAASFYASPESRRDRVSALYASVLGRAPDPDGLRHWVDALLRVDDVALAAFLAASDEYFERAQH